MDEGALKALRFDAAEGKDNTLSVVTENDVAGIVKSEHVRFGHASGSTLTPMVSN